jgi:hypothetical protein
MELLFSFLVAGIILFLCWSFGKSVELATRRVMGLDDQTHQDDR